MPRTRFSAALYLIVVFVSGALFGFVGNRLYTTTSTASANTAPRTQEEWRKRYVREMREKVGVDSAQAAKIGIILDETKRRFDELHVKEKPEHDRIQQEQVTQLKAVLNDQQNAKFDAWRADRERERKKAQKK